MGSSNTRFFYSVVFWEDTCPRPLVFAQPNEHLLQNFGQQKHYLHKRRCKKLPGMQCNKNCFDESTDKNANNLWKALIRSGYSDQSTTRLNIQAWNASIFGSFALLPRNLKGTLRRKKYKKFNGVDFSSTRAKTKVLASFEAGMNLPNLLRHVNITSLKHRSRFREVPSFCQIIHRIMA